MKGIKVVKICIGQDEPEVINLISKRVSKKAKFKNDIIKEHYCKVPLGRLTMQEHGMHTKQVAQMIIEDCVNRNEFNREYDNYLHGNSDLATDMMNFIVALTSLLIYQALSLWNRIFKFLGVTYGDDEVKYHD